MVNRQQAIDAMLKIARNEVGYLEKGTNANLNSKKDNAGYKNFTKYWAEIKPSWNGEPWCAAYVSWVFMKTFGLEMAQQLLKHWPFVYCPAMVGKFTLHSNPQVGDIVIFFRSGTFAHTGIVYKVEGDRFWTVEGNTSSIDGIVPNGGGVFEKSYLNSSLPGTKFCRPNYDLVVNPDMPIPEIKVEEVVETRRNYLQVGDTGEEVKELQEKLNSLGFKDAYGDMLTIDGEFGNNTLFVVKLAQEKYGLVVDGLAGKNTMQAIDNAIKNKQSAIAIVGNQLIKNAQIHLNNFMGTNLKITGFSNAATKDVFRKAVQYALNKDYGYNLVIDGIIGTRTNNVLRGTLLKHDSQGLLVTVLEIGMLLNKIDPRGVESPGYFGNGLEAAVKEFQKKNKLVVDGEAGKDTFAKLLK